MSDHAPRSSLLDLLFEAHPASLLGRRRAHHDERRDMERLRRLPPDVLRDIGIDPLQVGDADPRLVRIALKVSGRWT